MKAKIVFSLWVYYLAFTIDWISFNRMGSHSRGVASCYFDVGKPHAVWTFFFNSLFDGHS